LESRYDDHELAQLTQPATRLANNATRATTVTATRHIVDNFLEDVVFEVV
jgi:hypothetical protein